MDTAQKYRFERARAGLLVFTAILGVLWFWIYRQKSILTEKKNPQPGKPLD